MWNVMILAPLEEQIAAATPAAGYMTAVSVSAEHRE
jgi:hypothetical protein